MGEQALDDDQQCSMLGRIKMRMDMAGDHSIYREGSQVCQVAVGQEV